MNISAIGPKGLKKDRHTHTSPSCDFDVTSPKPTSVGKEVTEATQDTKLADVEKIDEKPVKTY